VINVDRKTRALGLSIKAKDIDDEKEAVASLKEQDESSSPGTIGDLIKAQMDDQ
jgi:small subunit ribosomal protein S1